MQILGLTFLKTFNFVECYYEIEEVQENSESLYACVYNAKKRETCVHNM